MDAQYTRDRLKALLPGRGYQIIALLVDPNEPDVICLPSEMDVLRNLFRPEKEKS
jgi:hypothetical protein